MWKELKGQIFLGNERFVEKMQARIDKAQSQDVQIPAAHRRPPARSLAQIDKRAPERNSAIKQAHATGAYLYQIIAKHFDLHFTTVGRIVRHGG